MEKDIHKSNQIAYRADIDGLRAIAIIAVLLFHTGFQLFSNGYIGVDIFFVISGFLITSITVREINKGKFTFTQFYTRRVKRLFPALFTMIIVVLIMGYFYLIPIDFQHLAQSSIYTVFYISNIYFSHLSGYFQPSVITLPLIHTWTLGVEEQYYLFYPAFLVIISMFLKKRYSFWVLLAGVASFVLQLIIMSKGHVDVAFYYFPTRAWEFMMGGIIAFGTLPEVQNKVLSTLLVVIGLVFISYPFATHMKSSELSSVMACIGATLIIYSNTYSDNAIKKILSTKGFVFIGLLSYSLYLWHWPILSAYREFSALLPETLKISMLILAFAMIFILSYLSYRFIETPIIKMDFSQNHKKLLVPVFAVMLLISSSSFYILYNNGLPDRFEYMEKVAQAPTYSYENNPNYPDYMIKAWIEPRNIKWNNLPTLGNKSAKHVSFVIIGDSHAGALAPAFDAIAKELGIKGKLMTDSANIPFFGIDLYGRLGSVWDNSDSFSKVNQQLLILIMEHPYIKRIFLVARWTQYVDNDDVLLKDNSVPSNNSIFIFQEGLDKTLKTFIQMNKDVYIVNDVPSIDWDVPVIIADKELLLRYFGLKTKRFFPPDLKQFERSEQTIFTLFHQAQERYDFKFLNPYKALCPNNGPCMVIDNMGYPIYVDDNHLSIHGALYIAKRMRSEFIEALK